MKRRLAVLITAVALVIAFAAPASAHIQVVDPPGNTDPKEGWVGGGPLPDQAQGQGLIPGGPTGEFMQPPAHANGLVQACESIRAQGRAAVDIFGPGPPGTATCPHGP